MASFALRNPSLHVLLPIGSAALLAWTGCSAPAEAPPQALECAALTARYLSSPEPVEILDFEVDPDSPRIRIDYRFLNATNVPGQGTSLCRFKLRLNGSVVVTDAMVDENRVPESDVLAFGKRRRSPPR